MAGVFSYLSILNPGFSAVPGTSSITGAGSFAYVSLLNVPISSGTVTVTTVTSYTPPPRTVAWQDMGVWVGTGSPGPGIQYADWVAGTSGYFMWLRIP